MVYICTFIPNKGETIDKSLKNIVKYRLLYWKLDFNSSVK